ncbi:MAG: sulfate adenylyltransferase [Elusimicrobia bacterium]|nr:sulfate adenylyltransferase [Elusimicrobiota bacterium]
MIGPHGGRLVNRVDESGAGKVGKTKALDISDEDYMNLENIATGVYSPLEGFMRREDYESVIHNGRLADGAAWTIPILMHVDKGQLKELGKGEKVYFRYRGEILGSMDIEDSFGIDASLHARKIYGTEDAGHPGVDKIKNKPGNVIGGAVSLYKRYRNPVFGQYHLIPEETRRVFEDRKWKTVVAFQTRNVPHIGHEYVQKSALTLMDGLFINPVMGRKKKGDFRDEVILSTYKILLENYYPAERAFMSVLTYEMHYAGPKEAIFHAIMRQNFGCTHFIVGRDHAGVGSFYGPFDAHRIFDDYPELGIEPVFFKSFFRCKKCNSIANDKICSHTGENIVNFAGTSIRSAIVEGKRPSEDVMRPEVSEEILRYDNPFVD